MSFATPSAFLLLIPVLIIFILSFINSQNSKASFKFSTALVLKKTAQTTRRQFAFLPYFLKTISIVLFVVALARPQKANTKVNRSVEGIDIVIAMDVSDSMKIEDMEPQNRLGAAKQTIRDFIKGRGSDRIGLVVFAGESYTRVPLTLDYNIVLDSLSEVVTTNLKQGTAIGVALANAVARIKDSTAKSRVIILLTDGENNSGTIDPATATEIAKGYNIKAYTIAIGRSGPAQIPEEVTDLFGRKIKQYRPIQSNVNYDLLQKIAETTGGKFFKATDTDALKQVFATIDKLEKTKINSTQYVKYTEMFGTYLLAALMLYVLQYLLAKTILRRNP
ncbi:MAG: VWA domain-containing protein [Oligoflexia bacterium]|nr:VWA domain-containing protein [Oligoflexia bacterium]